MKRSVVRSNKSHYGNIIKIDAKYKDEQENMLQTNCFSLINVGVCPVRFGACLGWFEIGDILLILKHV